MDHLVTNGVTGIDHPQVLPNEAVCAQMRMSEARDLCCPWGLLIRVEPRPTRRPIHAGRAR